MKLINSQPSKFALLCLFLSTATGVLADEVASKTESKEFTRAELEQKAQEFAKSELAIKFQDKVPYFVQENMGVNITGYKLNQLVEQDVFDKLVLVYKTRSRQSEGFDNGIRYAIMDLSLAKLTSYEAVAAGKYTPEIFYAGQVYKTNLVGCLRNSLAEANFNYCLVQFTVNENKKGKSLEYRRDFRPNQALPEQDRPEAREPRPFPPQDERKEPRDEQAPQGSQDPNNNREQIDPQDPACRGIPTRAEPVDPNAPQAKQDRQHGDRPQGRPEYRPNEKDGSREVQPEPRQGRSEAKQDDQVRPEGSDRGVKERFYGKPEPRPQGPFAQRPDEKFIPAPHKFFKFNLWALKGARDSGKYFDQSKYASPVDALPKTGAFRLYNFRIVTSEQDGKKEYKLAWDQGIFVPEEIKDVTTDGKPGLINPVYQKNPVFPVYRDEAGKMDNSVILFPSEEQDKPPRRFKRDGKANQDYRFEARPGARPNQEDRPDQDRKANKADQDRKPSKADKEANLTLQGYQAGQGNSVNPESQAVQPEPGSQAPQVAEPKPERKSKKDAKVAQANEANFIAFRTFNRYDLYQEHAFFSTKEDVEFDSFYKRGEDGFNLNLKDFNTLVKFSRILGGVPVAMQDKQYEHLDQYAEQPVPYLPKPGEVLASNPARVAKLSIYRNNFVGNQVYLLASSPYFFYGDELGSFDGSGTYDFSIDKIKAMLATIDRTATEIEVDVRRVGRYRAFKIPYAPQFQPRAWGCKLDPRHEGKAHGKDQGDEQRVNKKKRDQQQSPDPRPSNAPPAAENPQTADAEKQD